MLPKLQNQKSILPLIWRRAIWSILLNVHSKKADIYSIYILKCKDWLGCVRKSCWSIRETSTHCRFNLSHFFRTWQNSYCHHTITATTFYNALSVEKRVYTVLQVSTELGIDQFWKYKEIIIFEINKKLSNGKAKNSSRTAAWLVCQL